MENNWRGLAEEILKRNTKFDSFDTSMFNASLDSMLEAMDLVFEATKKECANKSEWNYDINGNKVTIEQNILNINKPNL